MSISKEKRAVKAKVASLLKKGDLVMVIAGGSGQKRVLKGKVGRILGFVGRRRDRVLVEGLNLITRHVRQTAPGKSAGKVQKEAGVHVSNVMYYVEKSKRPVRLRHRLLEDGKKVRGYVDPESKEFVQV